MRRLLTSVLFVASLAGAAYAADTSDVAPYHHWRDGLPSCDAPSVVARVAEKFAYQDARILHSGLVITQIDGVRESSMMAGGPGLIDRRYCDATALLSDGSQSEVVYVIEGPKLGTFSVGWHVDSCLPGYDPWHVHDAVCRSIRP